MMNLIRDLIFENGWIKAIALVSSVALFSYVHGAEDAQRSIYVDVSVTLPAEDTDMILTSQPPDRVRLTLRGSRSRVNAIRPESLPPVVINLADPEQRYYYFADDDFDMPAGVAITQVAPTSIPLEWARRIRRLLPVQARHSGALPDGLIIAEPPQVAPSEAEVVGAASGIERMRVIRTEPVDLTSLTEGRHNVRVPLERPPSHVRYGDENSANVVLVVAQDRSERVFVDVPLSVGEGVEAEVDTVDVTVEGPTALLARMTFESIQASVGAADLDEMAMGSVRVAGLPEGVSLVSTDPERVQLR